MTQVNVVYQRLHNQRIANTTFEKPGDVVKWLGAVQSQDYAAVKWGVAQCAKGPTDAALDQRYGEFLELPAVLA